VNLERFCGIAAAWWALCVGCASTGRREPCAAVDTAPSEHAPKDVSTASAVAVPFDLPKAKDVESVMPVLAIEIQRDGTLSAEGKPIRDDEELIDRARAAVRANPDLRVVLFADKDVPFGRVITVMDSLKQGGAGRIAFGVQPLGTIAGSGSAAPTGPFAEPNGSSSWKCVFPKAADAAKIDSAVVLVQVLVGPKGAVERVDVISDPGHGFGDAARLCAMTQTYRPAHDPSGVAIRAKTKPIRIRYER
jgi:biopolymer transport protein ExbD